MGQSHNPHALLPWRGKKQSEGSGRLNDLSWKIDGFKTLEIDSESPLIFLKPYWTAVEKNMQLHPPRRRRPEKYERTPTFKSLLKV